MIICMTSSARPELLVGIWMTMLAARPRPPPSGRDDCYRGGRLGPAGRPERPDDVGAVAGDGEHDRTTSASRALIAFELVAEDGVVSDVALAAAVSAWYVSGEAVYICVEGLVGARMVDMVNLGSGQHQSCGSCQQLATNT